MTAPLRVTAKAAHHAEEAERLLAAAGRPIFQFVRPMVNTPEQALMRAGVHAALANYYAHATLQELIPEGHDSCHVDSSCAGGPEPCGEERGEGR